jgi:hypothetical protein
MAATPHDDLFQGRAAARRPYARRILVAHDVRPGLLHAAGQPQRGTNSGTVNLDAKELEFAADGSLTIHLAHEEPADAAARANWLPAPEGQFALIIRAYVPTQPILDGDYKFPDVRVEVSRRTRGEILANPGVVVSPSEDWGWETCSSFDGIRCAPAFWRPWSAFLGRAGAGPGRPRQSVAEPGRGPDQRVVPEQHPL